MAWRRAMWRCYASLWRGIRISEALSLKRGDVPLGETLTILGKGRKERMRAGAALAG